MYGNFEILTYNRNTILNISPAHTYFLILYKYCLTVRVGTVGEDESRLYNELEVAILRASALPLGADNRPPTAYVHFQFLGTV